MTHRCGHSARTNAYIEHLCFVAWYMEGVGYIRNRQHNRVDYLRLLLEQCYYQHIHANQSQQ